MDRQFIPHVRRLIEERGLTFTFVDVGSRNGILELGDLAPHTVAYGFEPNPEEYEKLASGQTDAAKFGFVPPPFRRLTYLPYAISDKCGSSWLYVTRGAGACGLLEPDLDRLREIKWKGYRFHSNFGDDIFQVLRMEPVEVRTLEWFKGEHSIEHIDYLKIDVEGSEYEVLAGAGSLLNAVSFIKVEVCFIPFRKHQKLFSHIDLLLRDYGFDLLHFEIVPEQVGYKEREGPFTFGPGVGFPDRYGQPLSCDAIYVNRNVTDEDQTVAQAILLIEKNYLDEALFLLKTKVRGVDAALLDFLHRYQGDTRTRLVRAAVWAYRRLRKLARPIRSFRDWYEWRRLARGAAIPSQQGSEEPEREEGNRRYD